MLSSSNRVILITGAAHRIGATTAKTLHAVGYNIVLHYRSSSSGAEALADELNSHRENSVALVQGDLHLTERLPQIIEGAHSVWGRLDGLINNASTFYPTPVDEITEAHWDDLIGTNLKAPLFLTKAAAPYLKESQGSVVSIVDIHAERPLREHPVYSIAKAGLVMMTKSMAAELGPEIRVNAVAPGAILWPENDMDDNTKTRILDRTFLKRQGEAQNIADAVLFLLRDAHYTTGHILTVDGGRSLNS
ncbi:MAG: pteridine reductase [Gammaproteobacteria bacterium]|nr:pteridine reductase [Gammaproteobacteria bacterium]